MGMTSVDQLNVEKIVKKSGTSFYWGMKLLPKIKKRAMFSVYAFCRVVDDIADNSGTIKSKKIKLNDWKKKIQFPSKTEFELYCQRVAVAVGYLSIRIFGLTDHKGKKYAY